jgi:tripartite ATP-independent transporter DctM subunit
MSAQSIGLIGMAALILLILIRVPVAISLGIVGTLGYASLQGWTSALSVLGNVPMELVSYRFSVVPLFALMGALATASGFSGDLFRASNVIFSRVSGALALATVGASAAFSAVCGSSLATAATMTRVAIPEMLPLGYSPRLAAGAVAAGGTLGCLIPPSFILIIYAIITQQSIGRLFAASLIPAIILMSLYSCVVLIVCWLRPSLAPKPEISARKDSIRALLGVWHVVVLFVLVLGGIYFGWYSPTEAAAIGAFGAFALGLTLRRLSSRNVRQCLGQTIELAGSLFIIIMGSMMFSYFVAQTNLSPAIVSWLRAAHLSQMEIVLVLIVFYVALGCVLEGLGMILVTVPVVYPVVVNSGLDPAWFGVLLAILIEIGLIHPPIGMTLFVIRAQAPEISVVDMYIGVLPFLVAPFILIAILLLFPEVALWLPRVVNG